MRRTHCSARTPGRQKGGSATHVVTRRDERPREAIDEQSVMLVVLPAGLVMIVTGCKRAVGGRPWHV
eukprot:6524367-Pyramimonas_sp.AAC.1